MCVCVCVCVSGGGGGGLSAVACRCPYCRGGRLHCMWGGGGRYWLAVSGTELGKVLEGVRGKI